MNDRVRFGGPIFIFVGLVLTFTFLAVSAYDVSEPLGTFRRLSSLLPKAIQLLAFGALLSLVTTVGRRRLSWNTLTYPLLFLILLDLDHLPSFIEIDQPIRPAHSFILLLISLGAILAFENGRYATSLTVTSSFLGHLGADSPLFPLFAPISSELYSFGNVTSISMTISMTLVLVSIVLAFLSGRIHQRADAKTNG